MVLVPEPRIMDPLCRNPVVQGFQVSIYLPLVPLATSGHAQAFMGQLGNPERLCRLCRARTPCEVQQHHSNGEVMFTCKNTQLC